MIQSFNIEEEQDSIRGCARKETAESKFVNLLKKHIKMKKKVFSIIGVAAFAVAVAFNINASMSNDAEMDVTLANVEALVMGETSDEFTRATCCIACWDNHSCSGCDGRTHSYAHRA